MLYECHVTTPRPETLATKAVLAAVARELHWKTSCIDGDPVLGKKVFFYFTTHSTDYDEIHDRMCRLVDRLRECAVPPVREKIEQIVHDVRYKEAQ